MLKHAEQWTNIHRGINYKIAHWGERLRPGGIWNYYFNLNAKQLPEEYKDTFILVPRKMRIAPGWVAATYRYA